MNYFPFHVGDYAAHTAHLDELEDLAYRRMLDLYYRTEKPLPTDWRDIARLIRMKERGEQIETVLSEFFTLTDDGWVNRRCEDEISRMQDKQAKARTSAAASVKARNANAQRTLNERSTNVELPTPTPTPKEEKHFGSVSTELPPADKPTPPLKAKDLIAEGVDPQAAADWLALRKAKRLPLTATAWDDTKSEGQKLGLTPAQAVAHAVTHNWAGFRASWLDQNKPGQATPKRDIFAGAL